MPRKTVSLEYKNESCTIHVSCDAVERYEVRYGLCIKRNLTHAQAQKEIGACVLHALLFDGKVMIDGTEQSPT